MGRGVGPAGGTGSLGERLVDLVGPGVVGLDAQYLGASTADRCGRVVARESAAPLRRVWGAVRFSWWLTILLHRFPDTSDFDQRAQEAELDYIASSEKAQAAMCEQYAGLPFE